MTLVGKGGWYLLMYVILVFSTVDDKCNTSYIHQNIVRILPSLVIDIRVAPKIWKPRDQHSTGSLPPARSVEKRAWVPGCLWRCCPVVDQNDSFNRVETPALNFQLVYNQPRAQNLSFLYLKLILYAVLKCKFTKEVFTSKTINYG